MSTLLTESPKPTPPGENTPLPPGSLGPLPGLLSAAPAPLSRMNASSCSSDGHFFISVVRRRGVAVGWLLVPAALSSSCCLPGSGAVEWCGGVVFRPCRRRAGGF